MPANRCWPFCSEHHALSSVLLVRGACLGPFLVVEAGVVEDQGIVDNSPVSRHSRQVQLVFAARAVAVVGGETNPL